MSGGRDGVSVPHSVAPTKIAYFPATTNHKFFPLYEISPTGRLTDGQRRTLTDAGFKI